MLAKRFNGVLRSLVLLGFAVVIVDSAGTQKPPQQPVLKVSTIEKDLLTSLLTGYSTSFRPSTSNHRPVIVEFEMKLNKIVRVDIKEQVMVVNVKTLLRWLDPQLAWNRTAWNDTDYLNIPYSSIWTPDIMLYNTAREESKSPSDVYKSRVLVSSRGQANWASAVTFLASCELDIKWFPFDTQKCTLTFGSQSYTRSRLDLKFVRQPKNAAALKGKFHFNNGDWNLRGLTSKRITTIYDWTPEPLSVIEYTFDLTRLYTYYLLYLVLPCVGLILLAPFMFYIPADSGERTGFGVTVVLAMSVYLLVISDKLPEKSDKTPLLGAVYIVMLFLLVLAVVFGIVTTHLAYKTNHPPQWLWRLLFKRKKKGNKLDNIQENQHTTNDGLVLQTLETHTIKRPTSANGLSKRLSTVSTKTIPGFDDIELHQQKWRLIAARIDKIMFYTYYALVIIVPTIVVVCFI